MTLKLPPIDVAVIDPKTGLMDPNWYDALRAIYGLSPGDTLAFFGTSPPVSQPTAAAQAAITDGSGGTANPATGVATIGAAYSQAVVANAFATVIAQTNALRSALVALGLIKGA